jgi:CDP-glucose 4,6-dehydratase
VEGVVVNAAFWSGRRIFLTGHTGFKGSWLAQWLKLRGAQVTGYALAPPTTPNLFDEARVAEGMVSIQGDIRDAGALRAAIIAANPEVVIHLAAQALVRPSYDDPVGTYATNVMGTVHLLEGVRSAAGVRAVVVVTSDKCYDNVERQEAYREGEPLGGKDPYSSSKACAELVTAAYRHSFFSDGGAPRVASVRAGNVIGGGDWGKDRLVPDLLRAFSAGTPAVIRNPLATRPWQFVLDPLAGYLKVAEALCAGEDADQAWNFGPPEDGARPVAWIADSMVRAWGDGAAWRRDESVNPAEASSLKVDSTRARARLGWRPRLSIEAALQWTVEWHRHWLRDRAAAARCTAAQIERFEQMT